MQGVDLRQVLRERGGLPTDEAFTSALQIADGLARHPRRRRHPPRPEDAEHHARHARPDPADGLRHRQGLGRRRRLGHRHRPGHGHARVHEPRAGARREDRLPQRHLRAGHRDLRDLHRPRAVPGGDAAGHDPEAPPGAAAARRPRGRAHPARRCARSCARRWPRTRTSATRRWRSWARPCATARAGRGGDPRHAIETAHAPVRLRPRRPTSRRPSRPPRDAPRPRSQPSPTTFPTPTPHARGRPTPRSRRIAPTAAPATPAPRAAPARRPAPYTPAHDARAGRGPVADRPLGRRSASCRAGFLVVAGVRRAGRCWQACRTDRTPPSPTLVGVAALRPPAPLGHDPPRLRPTPRPRPRRRQPPPETTSPPATQPPTTRPPTTLRPAPTTHRRHAPAAHAAARSRGTGRGGRAHGRRWRSRDANARWKAAEALGNLGGQASAAVPGARSASWATGRRPSAGGPRRRSARSAPTRAPRCPRSSRRCPRRACCADRGAKALGRIGPARRARPCPRWPPGSHVRRVLPPRGGESAGPHRAGRAARCRP